MREIVKLEDRQGFIKKVQKTFVDAASQGINAAENEIKNMKFTIGEVEVPIDFNLEKETKKAFEKEYKKLAGSSIKIKKDAEKNLSKLYDITIKPNVNYKLDSSYKKGVTEEQEKSIQSRLKKVSKANKDIAEKAYREQYELYNKINSLANELVNVDILKTNDIDEYIDYAKKLNQYASLTEEARKKLKTEDWKQYKVSAIPKDVINGDINNVVAKTDTGKIKRDLSQAFKEVNSYVDNGIESISDNANYKGIKFVDRFGDGIVSQVEDEQDKIVEHIKILAKETAIKMLNAFDDTMDNNRALVKGEIVDINSIDKNMNEINSKIDKKAKDISTSLLERFEKLKVKIPIDANIVNSDITALRPFIKSFESVMGNADISNIVKSQLGDAFSEMEKYYNTFAQRVNETPSKSSGIKSVAQTESDINNLLEERNILENKRVNSLEVISSVTREEKRNIEDVIQDSNELSSKLETVENKLDEVKNDLSSLSNENSFSDMLSSASEIVKTFSDKLDEIKSEVVAINKSFENTVVLLGTLSDKMNVFNDGINIKDGLNIGGQVEELKESLLKIEDVKSNIDKELSGTGSAINLETETNSFTYLRELLSDIHILLDGKNDLLAEEVGLSEKVDSVENKVFKELREVILDVVDLLKFKNQYLEESAIHSNSIKDEVDKFEALSDKLKGINEYLDTLKSLGNISVKKGASESIDSLSKELIKLSTSLEVISKSDINDVKIDDIVNMVYKLSLLNDKLSGAKELLQIATILKKALTQLNTIKSDKYVNTINNLASLSTSLSEFVFTDSMKAGLEKAGEAYSNFANTLNNIPPVDINALKQVVQAYNVIAKANNIKVETQSKKSSKDNVDDSVKENLSALKKLESQLNTQSNKTVGYVKDIGKDLEETPRYIDELINKVRDLQKAYDSLDYKDPNIKNQIKAINDEFDELIPDVKKFQDSIKDKSGILATEKEVANLQRLYDKIFASSKLSQKYSVEKEMFGKIISSANKTKKEVDDITLALRKLESEANKAGNTGATAFEKWSNRMVSLASYLTTFASFYDIINMLREGISVVRELDASLTEMRKVSDESLVSLQAYQASTFDRAEKIGTTAYQLSNSTADWMRLGEDLKKASESADVSNILLNVSEFESIDDATQSLVSMSQAFKDIDKLDIVNKLNVIGNNFSISTDELASSLQRSAAALVTAGNDIDEAMALTVAGNAVTQDAQSVGAGLRTISLRIMGTEEAKEELASLGEDTEDFVVQTKSKLQGLVKDYTAVASNNFEGFDILKDNGEYKSTYEILLGISEIYKEILETDSKAGTNRGRALLEALAGKNRANIAASILQNPELLKQAYDSANKDYVDSAQKELDNYLDSVNGKITQIQSRAQEVAYNALDSESLKTILDNVLAITDGLAKVSKYLFSFPAILGTISGILSKMTGVGFFQGEGSGKDALSNPFSQIMQGLRSPALSKDEMTKLKDLHLTMQQYGKDSIEVQKAMNGLDDKLVSIANTSEFASKGIEGINVKSKIATMGVNLLKMALEGLAVAAITIGIQLIAKGIDKLIVTSEEAKDAVNELTNAYDTINSSRSSNLQTIESIKDRYYELSEGVSEFGENLSLNAKEYEEYKGLVSQISDVLPDLTLKYNEQGEAVGFLTGNISNLNEALDEQAKRDAQKYFSEQSDNIKDLIKTTNEALNGNLLYKGQHKAQDITGDDKLLGLLGQVNDNSVLNFFSGMGNRSIENQRDIYKNALDMYKQFDKEYSKVSDDISKLGIFGNVINGVASKVAIGGLTSVEDKLKDLDDQTVTIEEGYRSMAKEYSLMDSEYSKLNDTQRSYVENILNNISFEDIASNNLDSRSAVENYVSGMIESIHSNKSGVTEALKSLFELDLSNMSTLEAKEAIDEYVAKIAEILKLDFQKLKENLGFQSVDADANAMTAIMNRMSRTDPNDSTTIDLEAKKNLEEWVNLNDISAETLQSMMDNGAKAGDSFKKLDKILKKVQKDTKELDGKEITIDAHVKTLDTAKSDLATLETSYKDYKDGNGTVDVNSLNSISDSMKEINGSTEAYQEFLDVLTHMPEDTEAVQKAYNKLVTEYINGTGVLDNLTVANVEYTASELEKMGVVNATEVAYSGLGYTVETTEDQVALLQLGLDNCTDATTRAEFASVDLAKATNSEILSLAQATGTSDGLKFSLYQLAAQKMGVNAISLMTSGDLNNLIALMEQAGKTTNALRELAAAKANVSYGKSVKTKSISGKNVTSQTAEYYANEGRSKYLDNLAKEAEEETEIDYTNIYNSGAGASTNGGGGGGGNSKNTSPKKTKTKKTKKTKKSMSLTKTLYNWIERKLDVVARKADRAQERIDRLLDWDKKRNATLKALEAVEKQLDENYKASKRYYSYAKSQAKAEMKDAVAQVKKEGSKAQKKKYGKNLSQKTMDKYMKLVEEGKIGGEDIQAIKDPRLKAFIDAYIEWYEKAKAVDDELNSLTDTTKDLYDQLANNPLDKCAEQVERLSSEFEILQTKGTNAIVKLNYSFANLGKVASGVIEGVKGLGGYITGESFDTINKNANDQIKLLEKIFKQYEEAYAKAQYNFDIASGQYDRARASAVNLFANKDYKDLGVSEDVYNSMKSAIENNELIASDMITQFKASEQTILRAYLDAYQQRESTDTAVKKAEIDYEKNRQDSIAQERDINLDRFNAIKSLWDREMSDLNAQKEVLASQVALMEAYGRVYDRSNYDKQYDIEMDNIKLMKQQRDELTAYLAILPEGSSQWWDAKDALNAVNSEITEAIGNAYELKQQANAISDNLYDMYETLHGRINNELSFYEQLMEGYEDFDPVKHIATDQGLSRLFLYASQLSEAQAMAEKNAEIVKEYQKALDEANASGAERINATIMGSKVDKTITEAEQSLDDYYDKWQENILATKEMENNLIDWEISKLEEELSLAQEIVDARKDALNAEKNLHDYQRSIQDSTQNINNLQKQITVLKGDNSQEGKARVQALQKQLKDAQKNLEETEYEKYISAEQEMLDNLMEEYTTLIDEEKTHRDELLERAKLDIIANADKIGDTLNTTIEETGYKPQYTQDILNWLNGEQVQQFSNEIKDKLDAISQATKDGLGGLSVDFARYSSDLGRALEISEEEKKKYQQELKEAYESLNTTMGQVRDKSFAVDVAAPKITNETIVTLADGRVVISHNQTVDVKANADDPTNAGGTGSGSGNGSSGSGGSGGGNGNGQIFTDSSKTPEKEQQNNTAGANNVPKPDYSPTGVKDIVSQMHDADAQKLKEEEDAKQGMISKVWAFISGISRGDGLAKSLVDDAQKDFTGYGSLNQWVYAQTMDKKGKGLVLTTQGREALRFILGAKNDDEAFNKLYFDLGIKDPEWWKDDVSIIDKFMELNGKAKTKKNYTKANTYLYDHFNKVLSDENLRELTLLLGDTYDNASESGNLYALLNKALKGTTFSGGKIVSKKFAKGGIVDYVHGQGEDGIAMVRQGEGILTPAQTKTFMYELAPRMDDIIDASKLIKDATANLDKVVPMGETNVEATFQFDLENVTNAGDIIKQIQTNNNVQKAIQSVTIDRIAGGSRLGVNKF